MKEFFTFLGSTVIDGLLNVITWFINLFPSYELPEQVTDAIQGIFSIMYSFNFIFPIDVLFQVFTIFMFFELMFLMVKFVKWSIGFIRGSGS